MMGEPTIIAILSGAVAGLVAWGGVRIELRWLRRDVDRAHTRINHLQRRFENSGR